MAPRLRPVRRAPARTRGPLSIKLDGFELPGFGDKTPPSSFRIFPFGKIDTSKGVFTFDQDAARAVLSAWKDQGNQLPLDYDHSQVEGPFPAPAAGWYDLELRGDGLYAVNIKWTPKATEFLAQSEYRYFSPAFETDADNRVMRLINIALTNLPATKNMEPLVAAHMRRKETPMAKRNPKSTKLSKKDGLFSDFLAARCGDAGIGMGELARRMGMKTDELDEMSKAGKLDGELAKRLGDALDLDELKFSPWINGGETDADELDGELDDTETDDLDELDENDEGVQAQPKGGKKGGGKNNASQDLAKVQALSRENVQLKSSVTTLTSSVKELQAELVERKTKERETEVLSIVEDAIRIGKLQAPQREWALKTGRKSIETLKEFVANAQPSGPATFRELAAPPKDQVTRMVATLSHEENAVCLAHGTKPEDFAANKLRIQSNLSSAQMPGDMANSLSGGMTVLDDSVDFFKVYEDREKVRMFEAGKLHPGR